MVKRPSFKLGTPPTLLSRLLSLELPYTPLISSPPSFENKGLSAGLEILRPVSSRLELE